MRVFPYNPMNYDYQTLKATLTARQGLLNDILMKIEVQTTASSLQHYLIVGPRGIGKTHLLRLIYWTIKEKKNNWLVLQFAEEEYGVTNLAKFCQRIITEIANELTDFGEKIVPDYLAKIITELEEEEDDLVVVEKAISFLHQFTRNEKKRILLLVDNIDLIIGSRFMDNLSLKRLRTFLMDDNTALLIGASPTIFKEIIDYKEPLYSLFQRINLIELSQEDALIFIRKWAESTGEDKITSGFAAYVPKINAIYHLTGGNPRLLLFLFQIFTLRQLPEVQSAFESLLDEITPYFKAKMEALSVQQRMIMDALSKMDEAASPSNLASMLKLKPNHVTAIINTLVDNGYLKSIEKGKKKGTFYYDVVEQLFRIWYQIRSSTRQKKRFEWLIRFIESWYSLDELKEEKGKLSSKYTYLMEAGQVREAEMVRMHLACVEEVGRKKETKVQEWLEKGGGMFAEGRYDEEIACYDEALRINPQDVYAWNNKGVSLGDLGRYDEAIACYDEALRINPQDAYAWNNKGGALYKLGRYDEAIVCYDNATEYALTKPEDLQGISKGIIQFYLEQISRAILEKNMGIAQQLLSKIIAFKQALELHKVSEKAAGFNQLLMNSLIKLLKEEKAGEVIELLDILDKSEIRKYTAFLFPLKILAQYLQDKDEDILNRQKPEVKGIIKEILGKIGTAPYSSDNSRKQKARCLVQREKAWGKPSEAG